MRPRPGNEHRRDLRLGIYRLTLASVELALSAALTGLAGTRNLRSTIGRWCSWQAEDGGDGCAGGWAGEGVDVGHEAVVDGQHDEGEDPVAV